MSMILGVSIKDLPACCSCTRTVLALDQKLEAIRSMAKASFETCLASTSPSSSPKVTDETCRKRVKGTSGAEASPHTLTSDQGANVLLLEEGSSSRS